MDTAIGTFQADKEAAFTPKLGEVRPIDIFSHGRRETDENTVTNLEKALARDGSFFPILIREEGTTGYRLIAGHHRVEVSKRCFGQQAPIPAIIYPEDTPDPLIEALEIEENLFRKELTAAECQAQTIRWVAVSKKLVGNKLATELPVSDAKSVAGGGRGKKGWTAKAAGKLGLTKTAVQKRINAASAAIGEKIDLDRDAPEELERKAAELEKSDKRQRAEPNVVRLKRRKPAPRGVVEDASPPAAPHAGETASKIEVARKAFDALASKDQLRFIHDVCLHVGLDPLKMAPPAVFGLAEEEPELALELPAEAAPATDEAAVDAQAEQLEDAEDAGADDLQDTGDVSEAADQEPNGANLDADHLQEAGVGSSAAANKELGGATKCAHCTMEFYSSDERLMIHGRLYHADLCAKFAKPPIAIAA